MSKDVRMQVQCEGYGCKIYGEGVRSDLLKIGWVCLEGAWHCPSCSGEMCSDAAPSQPPETEWTSTPPTEPGWTRRPFVMGALAAMAEQVRTQDNAITGDPIFMVQRSRRIYGMDRDYADRFVWMTEDHDCEASPEEAAELDAAHDSAQRFGNTEEPSGWERIAYLDIWENVQPFFTRKGAEEYLRINGHNLRGPEPPRIYVESGYRNAEWQVIRELLIHWTVPIEPPRREP